MHPDTPHSRPRRRRRLMAALVAAATTLIAPLAISMGSPALADTTGTPDLNTRATMAPAAPPGPSPVATTGTPAGGTLSGVAAGQAAQVHVDGAAGKFFGVQNARLCRAGLNITTSSQMSPTQFGNCIAAPLPGPANDAVLNSLFSDPGKQYIDFNFRIGSGTETSHPGPGAPITCDKANPCALWLQLSVDTSVHPTGNVFKHFEVSYFGQSNAPGITVTPGSTQLKFDFTPPTTLFGGTVQSYAFSLSPVAGTCTPANPVPVSTPSVTCTGLTNFTSYTGSVTATTVASDGATTAVSPAATATAAPSPTWTPGLSTTSGDSKVTISWNPASGATQYLVSDSPAAGNCATAQTTPSSPFTCTGLTNGTSYTFTVVADYGGGNTSPPATISATPNGTLVTQHIYVSRPQGSLVLTQVCGTTVRNDATGTVGRMGTNPELYANGKTGSGAPYQNGMFPSTNPVAPGSSSTPGNDSVGVGSPDPLYTADGGYPYPQNPNTGAAEFVYPTDCRVDLGAAKLVTKGAGAGQYFKAEGVMDQVTVVDARDTDPGWTINGRTTSFTSGVNSFSGDNLGWTPKVTYVTDPFTSPDGSYQQIVTAGPAILNPAFTPGSGLGSAARTMATAPAKAPVTGGHTGGLGIARLDGDLHLLIPIFAISGNYVSVLTVTAI